MILSREGKEGQEGRGASWFMEWPPSLFTHTHTHTHTLTHALCSSFTMAIHTYTHTCTFHIYTHTLKEYISHIDSSWPQVLVRVLTPPSDTHTHTHTHTYQAAEFLTHATPDEETAGTPRCFPFHLPRRHHFRSDPIRRRSDIRRVRCRAARRNTKDLEKTKRLWIGVFHENRIRRGMAEQSHQTVRPVQSRDILPTNHHCDV